MKKTLISILTIFTLHLWSPFLLSEEKNVSLSYVSYPPYYDKDLELGGPLSEIIVAAFADQGYRVRREQLPWSRAIKWTEEGKFDGLYSAWYREEREEHFAFSSPLPGNELVLFKQKKTQISFKDYKDLKPYSIGVVRGYANPPGFDEADLNLAAVTTDKQNLLKLADSRIDLALVDKALGKYILKTELPSDKASQIDWIEPPLKVENQYLMFSKKAPDYQQKLEAFNKGLKVITENGELQRILEKHGI